MLSIDMAIAELEAIADTYAVRGRRQAKPTSQQAHNKNTNLITLHLLT
jgi:hypothetical protein